jgi:hypothetical protein
MMELLKESDRRDVILSHLVDEVWQTEAFTRLGVDIEPAQARVTEFFTGLMPVIMFVLISKPWEKLYGQDESELTKMFIKAFDETHVRYSLDLFKQSKGRQEEKGR